jgi:glycosyltransferase involved in cell wall biosynthesis
LAAEAFILGCPVIGSDCIGLREVVKDTPAMVVKKEDPGELAVALKEFMQRSSAIKQRALTFVAEARERYDSRKTAEQLNLLFDKVISLSRDRA